MARDINLLDSIQIATPCHASWSAMKGDDRTRFCDQCSLHVYNIAELTRDEVEKLIVETEGRLCARLYRRHDGTVITKDCPVGYVIARRQLVKGLSWLAATATASLMALATATGHQGFFISLRDMEPFSQLVDWLNPPSVAGGMVGIDDLDLSYTARNQRIEWGDEEDIESQEEEAELEDASETHEDQNQE